MIFFSSSCLLFTNITMTTPIKQILKQKPQQITLALLKPDICANAALPPKIRQAIANKELQIVKERDVLWTEKEAGDFYAEHKGKFFYHRLCGYMTSGPFKALILSSPNAIKDWRGLIGPTHPVRYGHTRFFFLLLLTRLY